MLIDEFIDAEDCVSTSNIQTKDFSYVKLVIVPVQEATVMPLLYDVGEGRVFGQNTMVDVCLFDSEDRRQDLETLAANMFIGAFPWLKSITVPKKLGQAMKSADYVILNPRMLRKKLSFKYAMFDQALFFVTMAEHIHKHASTTAWVTVVTPSYTSLYCHILKSKLPSIPPCRITGLKLHVQVLVTNMIADKMNVPPENVKGVIVWGENIVDFQLATVDLIPHQREPLDDDSLRQAFKTYWESRNLRKGFLVNEENIGMKMCDFYNGGKDKNHQCTYCRGVEYRKHIETTLAGKEGLNFVDNESTMAQGDNSVNEKCQAVKDLQDDIMQKITDHLKSKGSKKDKREKLDEKELLDAYRKGCPSEEKKSNIQISEDGKTTNIIPIMELIQDHHWLFKDLPRICLQASSKPGGAMASCLSKHMFNLHFGTKKPFSIMACVDDAYNFPKGLYTSGPCAVDSGTGSVSFYPSYEMSVNTQLKLFRQIVKIKKQCLLLDGNFWENEAAAFDRKMMPLIEKNEHGIAPASKRCCPMKESPSALKHGFGKPSKAVRELQDVILWYKSQKSKKRKSQKKQAQLKRAAEVKPVAKEGEGGSIDDSFSSVDPTN